MKLFVINFLNFLHLTTAALGNFQGTEYGNINALQSKSISAKAIDKMESFYAGCGETKGCFGIPSDCIAPNKTCEMFTSWREEKKENSVVYAFQIAGQVPKLGDEGGHVSMGLSYDIKMGTDSVVSCIWNGQLVEPRSFYNIGYSNKGFTDLYVGLTNRIGEKIDDYLFCEFVREPLLIINNDELNQVFNLTNDEYFILLARANKLNSNGPGPHLGGPGVSESSSSEAYRLNAQTVATGTGGKSNLLVQIHGSLMIIAWVLTSSLGMFVARYYKQTYTDINPFSKALWFIIHVMNMVMTILLTFAGTIIIFVEVGGYSSNIETTSGKAHPILGIFLCSICFFQLIIGFFRPHPNTPNRFIFNWAHWSAGNLGHIVGVACLFLAAKVPKSGLNDSKDWYLTVGLFLVFHVLMHITLSAHTVLTDNHLGIERKYRGISFGPMKPSKPIEAPGTRVRTILLVLYIVGIISFGAALITQLVKASA